MANPEIVALLKLQSTQFVGELRKVRGDFRTLGNDARNLSRFLVGIFATGAIARYAKQVVNLGDELSKMNQKTGQSVEFLNGLTQAGDLAGISSEKLSVGIRTLNKNLLDAKNGTGEAKDELLRFGISAAESGQLLHQPEQSFLRIVDVLAKIPTASERAAVAQKLMGRSGADLLPLINQGSKSLEKQIKALHEHRKITTEQAQAAEKFNDSLTSLETAFQGLLLRGVGPLLPVLTDVVKALTALVALDIDSFTSRIAAMTGQFNPLRGVVSLILSLNTALKDMAASVALVTSLVADPSNYRAILKEFEEIDKEIREEANRRQSLLFPEATGGKPVDFSENKPDGSKDAPFQLEETVVKERSRTAELDALIKQRQARIALIETEEERLEIETGRIHILKEEIALLQAAATIQKEIEAAVKEKRDVDPTVAITAEIQKQADLNAIQNERIAKEKELHELEQVGRGNEAIATATQQQKLKLLDAETRLAEERFQLELESLDPLRDASLLRGRQITVLNAEMVLLRERQEVLGELHVKELEFLEARKAAIIAEGRAIDQAALGRGIVAGATADIQRQLEPFQRAVRDAQKEVERGQLLPNQLPETNRLRRIELIEKELALLDELHRVGMISTEEFNRQFLLQDAQLRAETATTQQGFLEGWQEAFRQLAADTRGVFGLGQTLARNFVSNIQQGIGSTINNIFSEMEKGTLSWRTALQTIPDILQQITSQLISMMIVQGLTQAIGGGLGGLFGGTTAGTGAIAGPRTANNQFFPQLGFATGGSFIVGGPSGTDKTPVNFWATRGERVTVETPAQQQRHAPRMSVTIINNAGVEVSAHEREGFDGRTLEVLIEKKVNASVQRGSIGRTISNQFGLPRAGRRN